MGTTGLGEGHEKTGTSATWQSDGLRDTDVLSTATLTNFLERGLGNAVIPITMTDYSADSGGSDRNNPISGNACVRPNTGSQGHIYVDTGTVCLDGTFYSVGSATSFAINTSSYYNSRFNAGGMVLPSAANEECWVLVIVDPELTGTNNVGLVCGTVVDTSTGIYPQMPSGHLVKQSLILGAVRLTYGSPPIVAAVEDKRVFLRGGPIPLTALKNTSGNGTEPLNDYSLTPALNAGNLPISGLGLIYARDPNGFAPGVSATAHGNGETHLFYTSDEGLGAGAGSFQLTPTHRNHKEVIAYSGAGAGATLLSFTPLTSETDATKHLITATWFGSSSTQMCPLREGVHFTVSNRTVTFLDLSSTVIAPLGPLGPGDVEFYYTHSGETL